MRRLLMVAGGGTAVVAPPAPELTALRQVTDNTSHNRFNGTITQLTTYRLAHTVKATSRDPRIVLPELVTTDAYTVTAASLEYKGIIYPVTFSGSASVTVANLAGPLVSDAVTGLTLTAGDVLYARIALPAGVAPVSVTALTQRNNAPGNLTGGGAMEPAVVGVSDYQFALVGIHALAAPSTVSVALIGDSILERQADANTMTAGGFGRRALQAAGLPWTNYSVSAHQHGSSYAERAIRYGNLLPSFTHALVEYGLNDSTQQTSLANLQAAAIQHWVWLRSQGPKLWQATITPLVTTTDQHTTLEGQTPWAGNARRVGYNDWVRDGAPILSGVAAAAGTTDPAAVRAGHSNHPLAGWIEVADTVESSRNSGKWAVNGTANWLVQDGGHPLEAGHLRMMVPVQAWAATLTTATGPPVGITFTYDTDGVIYSANGAPASAVLPIQKDTDNVYYPGTPGAGGGVPIQQDTDGVFYATTGS